MADDGMLINFDIGDEPFTTKPTFKGGSWKERLTAKKAAEYNRAKAAKHVDKITSNVSALVTNGSVQTSEESEGRSPKKPRLDELQALASSFHPPRANRANTSEKRIQSDRKPHQVVSSLFSFNPVSKTADQAQQESTSEPAEPSNAPLKSELDTFTSLGLSAQLAEHLLKKLNIKAPTAIQQAAITQLVKEDTDAFIQAETGSGKTLAYLLPIVQRIMNLPSTVQRDSGLFAIVLAPTRELSKQISVVLESLLRCAHWIVSGTVIGGEKKKSEKARLRKGLNILIATPGRLADHLDHTEVLDVGNVRWLVLDEGDRLMELGFEQDIEKILSKLNARASTIPQIKGMPSKRTTVLCSATMKMNVQKLGEISLKDAVHIQGAATDSDKQQVEEGFSAPAQLKQSYAVIPAKLRLVSLTAILKRAFARRGSVMKAIVFISCADSVDFHFEVFARSSKDTATTKNSTSITPSSPAKPTPSGLRTSARSETFSTKDNSVQLFRLHGSLPQATRTSTLAAFSTSKDPAILLSTDVASRGLDLPNIDLVLEYDPPFTHDDHVHRIGRTARAGAPGRALIFLQPGAEEGYVDVLAPHGAAAANLTRHSSAEVLRKGFGSPGLGGGGDWEARATEWQLEVERWALEGPTALEAARRAFQGHVRAYATHVAAERGIFDMTALHLGHLAKAFALRDRPGSIKVPGLRPGKASVGLVRAERRKSAKASKDGQVGAGVGGHEVPGAVDAQEAGRKMRTKARAQAAGASEFNIG